MSDKLCKCGKCTTTSRQNSFASLDNDLSCLEKSVASLKERVHNLEYAPVYAKEFDVVDGLVLRKEDQLVKNIVDDIRKLKNKRTSIWSIAILSAWAAVSGVLIGILLTDSSYQQDRIRHIEMKLSR